MSTFTNTIKACWENSRDKIMLSSVGVSLLLPLYNWSAKANTAYADNPADYFKGKAGISKENMEQGTKIASPLLNLLGTGAGFIFAVVVAWQVIQTAIDLAYLYIPLLRGILSPDDTNGASNGQNPSFFSRLTTVSDSMQKAMELNGSNVEQTNLGAGASSGMGGNMGMNGGMNGGMGGSRFGGMGGMSGGMGMGGMSSGMGMGMGQQSNPGMGNAPINKKNTALTYFKDRAVALVLLMVCIGVLSSSVLTDSGINLAELILKVLAFFNGKVESVN